MIKKTKLRARLALVAAATLWIFVPTANAQSVADSPTLKSLGNYREPTKAPGESLSLVRRTVISEAARVLGGQAGRRDRTIELRKQLDGMEFALDRQYEFGQFVLPGGFLPPVIIKSSDLMTVGDNYIRMGADRFEIYKGASPAPQNPSWRQWMYIGLAISEPPSLEYVRAGTPKNREEQAFFDQELAAAYKEGRDAADRTLSVNYAELEKVYSGMRNFYELLARGMVTAPKIKSRQSIVTAEGRQVIVTGDTYFEVVTDTNFVMDAGAWKPLGVR